MADCVQLAEMVSKSKRNNSFFLKPVEAGSVLLSALQRFYAESKLFDVKISCNGEILFGCHKIVLASFSSYFESLLSGTDGCAILNMDAVNVEYVKHLKTIVNYMYGCSIIVNLDDGSFEQLYDSARIFGVTALIKALSAQAETAAQKANSAQRVNGSAQPLMTLKACGIGTMFLVNFQRFKAQNQFADVNICCGGKILFSCHKLVLAAFSAYFESLLLNTEGAAILNLDAVDALYVRQLSTIINYMYGKTACVRSENFDLLRDSARVFGVHALETGDLARMRLRYERARMQSSLKEKLERLRHERVSSDNRLNSVSQGTVSDGNRAVADRVILNIIPETNGFVGDASGSPVEKGFCSEATESLIELEQSTAAQMGLQSQSDVENGDSLVDSSCSTNVVKSDQTVVELQHCENLSDNSNSRRRLRVSTARNFVSHSEHGGFLCKACGYSLATWKAFLIHVDTVHVVPETVCQTCGQTFASRQELNIHCSQAHELPMYVCPQCKKSFKTLPGFKNHIDTHGQAHRCRRCSFTTTTRKNLELHTKKHHPNGNGTSTKSARRNSANLSHLPHKCSECSATFLYECLLMRHFQTRHLKLKPFTCPFCGHSATEKGALQTHIRCVHTGEMPFKCDICNFRCKTSSILSRHRKMHTGERPYACEQCDMKFMAKRDFNVHNWKVHLKHRPFKCPTCGVGFFRKDNLLQHRRSIHKQVP